MLRFDMKIEDISTVYTQVNQENKIASGSSKDFMVELWDVIGSMNETQTTAQTKMQDVVTGKSDDSHGALIALEKASLQLEIATTVRDKAVYAFNKLMDTQI